MIGAGREDYLLLRGRVVLPISRPPIDDGGIAIVGKRLRAVGSWKTISKFGGEVIDLGETILLPGLINAHCHLDYTRMSGEIPPQAKFTDWLNLIMAAKGGWSYSDFAESWLAGAKMLLRTGTTTVADVEMSPELLPEVWSATPLRVFSFLEMTGVISRRPPREILAEAEATIQSLKHPRCRVGLSPHAPYSTAPALLRQSAELARRKGWRVVTHVSESDQEYEMFARRRGEMFKWLNRNGRDMADCGLGTPTEHLARHKALNENLLAIHLNFLGPRDASLLGRRGVNAVHCPRTHAYFSRPIFPYDELSAARVNVCLGTDSLASVYKPRRKPVELSMFEEMRQFATSHPLVAPETILQMATLNGARALGLAGKAGEFRSRAFADIIAIPFSGHVEDSLEAVVQHRGNVLASMIEGQWAFGPHRP